MCLFKHVRRMGSQDSGGGRVANAIPILLVIKPVGRGRENQPRGRVEQQRPQGGKKGRWN